MGFVPGHTTLATARSISGNAKIGDAATTYAAQASCPRLCVFFDGGGCYAETGRIGKFVTKPLNDAADFLQATALDVAFAEADAIDNLTVTEGRPLRLHTVGDCASDETARIVAAAAARYIERGGGPVWTYTHGWRETARESWGIVNVLASCETADDVARARSRGYATAIVVEEFASDKLFSLQLNRFGSEPNGAKARTPNLDNPEDVEGDMREGELTSTVRVLPCPQQTRDIACSDCGLCMNDAGLRDRGYSIGFELHGIPYTVRMGRLALRSPADPERRLNAEARLRRMLDERPDLTAREAAAELVMNEPYAGQLLAFLRGHAEHPSVLRRRRYDRKKVAA